MYRASMQGVDECMINVRYRYYYTFTFLFSKLLHSLSMVAFCFSGEEEEQEVDVIKGILHSAAGRGHHPDQGQDQKGEREEEADFIREIFVINKVTVSVTSDADMRACVWVSFNYETILLTCIKKYKKIKRSLYFGLRRCLAWSCVAW